MYLVNGLAVDNSYRLYQHYIYENIPAKGIIVLTLFSLSLTICKIISNISLNKIKQLYLLVYRSKGCMPHVYRSPVKATTYKAPLESPYPPY